MRESDAQLRLLIENSRDMISRHQPDGKVVYVSPACETLLGYSPSEIVEAGAGDFVHPDDIDGVWEAIQAALEGGYDTYRVEHRMRCKSGDYIWIETIGRLLYTPEGELAEIQCMARDISERKRAENLLRIQRDLALALSSENQMKTVVDKLLEYLLQIEEFDCGGVYLVDEETGALDLIFHTGLTSEFAEQVAHYEADTPQTRYVMTGASLYRSYDEILSETKDSVRRQEGLRVLAVIPVIFEGQVIAALNLASHTYTDIPTNVRNAVETMATSHIGEVLARINAETALQTLNAKLEQRVTQRTAELEALNQDLRSFAYTVSHDLKSPLRNINQLAQWLIEDYAESFDEEGRKMFELLMSTVKQMDRLIKGILDYSRVGRKVGETLALDLDILVEEVIDLLGPPPQIHIHIEQPLPTVMGDRVRLEQVFQNLLSNAIKFMDKPDGRISIHCLDEGAYWKFSISDNGPGIEPKYYEKIFQIFHTLHTHDEQENTGIGLAIVKKIVEFYDGRIWVESTLGEGSVFFFTLPKKGK